MCIRDRAQTTLYTYNDQFRVSLEIQPDGGYTRYEYDDQGRVILQATPWAGGGEKGTRTTYADLRFNDFRPATEREIIIAQDGTETVLSQRSYTYEDSVEINRTTVTETALGSDQVHTSVSETYGEAAQYPYACLLYTSYYCEPPSQSHLDNRHHGCRSQIPGV